MKLTKITWKNISAYGNCEETLNFEKGGLWRLFGRSGAGKSSIIQMPILLFYGKAMEKNVRKGDIANRINKHGVITGEVEVGSDKYIITRMFEPDGIELIKNGESMDFATNVECQRYIENIILCGLPIEIYKNMIVLSLLNFTSFVTISAADKRAIVDNVFSMSIVNDCASCLKTDKKLVASEINSENGGIAVLEGNIRRTEQSLAEKKAAVNFDPATVEKEGQIVESIRKIDARTPEIFAQIRTSTTEYNDLLRGKSKMESDVMSLQYQVTDVDKRIHLFKQDKCPTCGSPFNTDGFLSMLSEFEASRDALLEDIRKKQEEIAAEITKINECANKSTGMTEELNKLNTKRSALNDWLQKISSYKMASFSIDETQSTLDILKKDRDAKVASVQENTSLIEMLNMLEAVYSDNGVKKYHRERYIPTLNNELKYALEALEFPYQLTFDNDFNANVYDRGEKINIATLSVGERKRVDVCVLCSMIRIIKQKYPSINVIAFDETISSLDYDTSVLLLKYLKKSAEELGLNIIIISHTTLDDSLFDNRVFVEKKGRFSTMTFV